MDTLLAVATPLILAYALAVAIYITLQNRSPQATFAWLLLFLTVPIVGVFVYRFAGRGWRAFSKQNELARQELGGELLRDLGPILARERETVERIAAERTASFRGKLLRVVPRSDSSILTGSNEVEILQDARQKYPRLLADIRAARHHVHLSYYIWTEDSFTLELKDALIERARAGVAVRCLYDAMGGALSGGYLRELTDAGVSIHPYLEYRSFTRLHSINYRSHRKIAVVDGRIGYVGGLNLDKEQLDPPAFDRWRDTHLRLFGEAAHALQASFAVSWYNTTGEEVADPAYYPPVEVPTFLPVQITQGGPDSQWRSIRQLYFMMILSAEEKLYLQSPFFVPDESIVEALRAVARAGVDVRLMFTPRGAKYQIPYRAAHTYFQAVAQGRRQDLPVSRGLLPPEDAQHGRRGGGGRHSQHGHPQLRPELRDRGRALRRGEGAGVGGPVPRGSPALRGVDAGGLPERPRHPPPARLGLSPRRSSNRAAAAVAR